LPKLLAIYPIHSRITYAAEWHRAGLFITPSRVGSCVLVVAILLNIALYSLNIPTRYALLFIILYEQFRDYWYDAIRKSDAFYVSCQCTILLPPACLPDDIPAVARGEMAMLGRYVRNDKLGRYSASVFSIYSHLIFRANYK
jgi:hypothetical protein